MPLARVDLLRGKSAEYLEQIGQIVYRAMVETIGVPRNDRFMIIHEHDAATLQFDRSYLNIARTEDCVFLQVTLNQGRTLEMKRCFYKAIADGLHDALKLRREDVFINLVEVQKENWSFGNGEAQYG
jgi:4-oxalocrotonate tautomerase